MHFSAFQPKIVGEWLAGCIFGDKGLTLFIHKSAPPLKGADNCIMPSPQMAHLLTFSSCLFLLIPLSFRLFPPELLLLLLVSFPYSILHSALSSSFPFPFPFLLCLALWIIDFSAQKTCVECRCEGREAILHINSPLLKGLHSSGIILPTHRASCRSVRASIPAETRRFHSFQCTVWATLAITTTSLLYAYALCLYNVVVVVLR